MAKDKKVIPIAVLIDLVAAIDLDLLRRMCCKILDICIYLCLKIVICLGHSIAFLNLIFIAALVGFDQGFDNSFRCFVADATASHSKNDHYE